MNETSSVGIIILNIVLLYHLLAQLETDSDQYYQAGAFVGYILLVAFINVVFYMIFRITEKRNKLWFKSGLVP